MIHSMTAFGSARIESELGSLTVELRTVNSRFHDIHIRMPDELRFVEPLLREHINRYIGRGKVDVRLNYSRHAWDALNDVDPIRLEHMAKQLTQARRVIPDMTAPCLLDVLSTEGGSLEADGAAWSQLCA